MFLKKKDLIVYTLKVDGMRCGMCETHVNDIVRRNFNVKKVKSSVSKGETIIYSEKEIDIEKIASLLKDSGYIVSSFEKD